jgi:molybdopterin-guanine dinucleotide biosynthesis protein A|tara:strand:+ start:135 stop:767 length:633 start_codon:yes stop_codon:yes gene_type:complete
MIQNKSNLIGLILAGGLSTRMNKEHKFLKKINKKKTLMEVIIERALKQVPKLIINANINKSNFKKFKLDIVKDSIKGFQGPLAGILSGMEYAQKKNTKWIATFPCDAPFFPDNLVKKLLNTGKKKKKDIVIVKCNSRLHPVFGIWSVKLKNSLKEALVKNQIRKIYKWIEINNFAVVNFNYNKLDPFFNINDKKDLKKANDIFKKIESSK